MEIHILICEHALIFFMVKNTILPHETFRQMKKLGIFLKSEILCVTCHLENSLCWHINANITKTLYGKYYELLSISM